MRASERRGWMGAPCPGRGDRAKVVSTEKIDREDCAQHLALRVAARWRGCSAAARGGAAFKQALAGQGRRGPPAACAGRGWLAGVTGAIGSPRGRAKRIVLRRCWPNHTPSDPRLHERPMAVSENAVQVWPAHQMRAANRRVRLLGMVLQRHLVTCVSTMGSDQDKGKRETWRRTQPRALTVRPAAPASIPAAVSRNAPRRASSAAARRSSARVMPR